MTKKRSNDTTSSPKTQSPRCYEIEGLWFFELRGGGQHGPYDSKPDMEAALNEFITLHEEMSRRNST